ncbi:hypothetical protein KI387_034246, partial [Taxus chinensis]
TNRKDICTRLYILSMELRLCSAYEVHIHTGSSFYIENLPAAYMAMDVHMHFRGILLLAVFILLLVIGVSAQEDSCSGSDDIGKCGLNGFCLVKEDNSFNCTCPPEFHPADNSDQSRGCLRNISQEMGCNASTAEMHELDRIDWWGNDYAHMTGMNTTACKRACIEDCYCAVTIYADLNGTGNCWKKESLASQRWPSKRD